MKKLHRHITATVLALLYILIALTPLSPLMLKSAHIAHAVTGECSGDCDIDGCSLESRVNHTCCCWQKKLKLANVPQKSSNKSCCAAPATVTPLPTASCCATPASKYDKHDYRKTKNIEFSSTTQESTRQTVFKCGTPCGSGKILVLIKLSTDEIIPYSFVTTLAKAMVSKLATSCPPPLISRSIEPPEPPPRLSIIS